MLLRVLFLFFNEYTIGSFWFIVRFYVNILIATKKTEKEMLIQSSFFLFSCYLKQLYTY